MVLRYLPVLMSLLGCIALATGAPKALTVAIYVLAIAAVGAHFLVDREQEKDFKVTLAAMKADAETWRVEYERRKATYPAESMQAIVADPTAPAEPRAELSAELVRRGKGVLN